MLCHPHQVPALLRLKRKRQLPHAPALQGQQLFFSLHYSQGVYILIWHREGWELLWFSAPLIHAGPQQGLCFLALGKEKLGALVTLAPPKDSGIFLQYLHLPDGAAELAHLPTSYLLPFPMLQLYYLIFSSVDMPMKVMKVLPAL